MVAPKAASRAASALSAAASVSRNWAFFKRFAFSPRLSWVCCAIPCSRHSRRMRRLPARFVHNKCFPPGTLVLMGDGSTKPIEKIELGDTVLAKDPESAEQARPAEVTGLLRDFADGLVDIPAESGDGRVSVVTATCFHPFWTRQRGSRWRRR